VLTSLWFLWFTDLSSKNTMIVLIVIGMVHMLWWYYCCTSLYSPKTYVVLSTQNQVLAKVMLKFIALQLMSYFNSINSSETPITLICFIKCVKITQIFLCMKCNEHICCLYFMTYNPGILQSLPLKLNFDPKFSLSYIVGQTCWSYQMSWSSFTN
jgi:hypothetical protein